MWYVYMCIVYVLYVYTQYSCRMDDIRFYFHCYYIDIVYAYDICTVPKEARKGWLRADI